jgi:hypothetical protein
MTCCSSWLRAATAAASEVLSVSRQRATPREVPSARATVIMPPVTADAPGTVIVEVAGDRSA